MRNWSVAGPAPAGGAGTIRKTTRSGISRRQLMTPSLYRNLSDDPELSFV
jgi:hypothetical protein